MNNQDEFENKIDQLEDEEVIKIYFRKDEEKIQNNPIEFVSNDISLEKNDIEYMKSHNESFDKLLKTYVENAEKNLNIKIKLKRIFFNTCIVILILVFILLSFTTIVSVFKEFSPDTLLTLLIPNVIAFLTSFIVLPHTIATYLFNSDEEKNMTELIKSIQEYDKTIREEIKKII